MNGMRGPLCRSEEAVKNPQRIHRKERCSLLVICLPAWCRSSGGRVSSGCGTQRRTCTAARRFPPSKFDSKASGGGGPSGSGGGGARPAPAPAAAAAAGLTLLAAVRGGALPDPPPPPAADATLPSCCCCCCMSPSSSNPALPLLPEDLPPRLPPLRLGRSAFP